MSGQSMVRLGKTQGTDLERLHRGLQIAQNSSHLDGSFTNSKPKCLPLNLPNFKKNKPYQRLHFPSQINQLWARKNGKTRKIGCPWPLCGCSRIYHGSEATLHVRSPLKKSGAKRSTATHHPVAICAKTTVFPARPVVR